MVATMDVLLGSFIEVAWKIIEKKVITAKTKWLWAFPYTLKYILQEIMKNHRAETSFAVHSV